jgi:SAM-dependent methyltransferase
MKAASYAILAHHETPAIMWGLGGKHYDDVSFAVSGALAHAAQRLNARAGERILDVATGTGWSARNVARTGAAVTGVDISRELLLAARELSGHVRPAIDFRQGDAECLPFDDGAFDGVISTFGVMFAVNQSRAAAELARVCRSGGRLALATWASRGAVAEFFGIIGRYREPPPQRSSPLAFGRSRICRRAARKGFRSEIRAGRQRSLSRQCRRHLGVVRPRVWSAAPTRRESSL